MENDRIDASPSSRDDPPSKRRRIKDMSSEEPSTSVLHTQEPDDPIKKNFVCLICLEVYNDPYVTACGHSFCSVCIMKSLNHSPTCPTCRRSLLRTVDGKPESELIPPKSYEIFPNIDLRNAVEYLKKAPNIGGLTNDIPKMPETTDLAKLELLKKEIESRIACARTHSQRNRLMLFRMFLIEYSTDTDKQIEELMRRKQLLNNDLRYVQQQCEVIDQALASRVSVISTSSTQQAVPTSEAAYIDYEFTTSTSTPTPNNMPLVADTQLLLSQIDRMKEMWTEFTCLYDSRFKNLDSHTLINHIDDAEVLCKSELVKMAQSVDSATKYTGCRSLGVINYGNGPVQPSSSNMAIVSSIEFDSEGRHFVLAGVTKKIKLYNFDQVVNDSAVFKPSNAENASLLHQPIMEMECQNKISCVSWNYYSNCLLASSDYEGIVQLWDPFRGQNIRRMVEHEKRCWTVQFSSVEPNIFASGSDDGHMKMWSVNCAMSIRTIDVGVNICCVNFAPNDSNYLVLGAADHNVHRYDLRRADRPVTTYSAHSKAVSYVKYLDDTTIVSASTDSTLRLWSLRDDDTTFGDASSIDPVPVVTQSNRVFTGHVNEKNFVGLSCNQDIIVCGSELNALHVYHTDVSKALLSYDFSTQTIKNDYNKLAKEGSEEPTKKPNNSSDFVSAVCCKNDSNIVVGANSKGIVEILELV